MLSSLQFSEPLWFLLLMPTLGLLLLLWKQRSSDAVVAAEGIIAPHLARLFSLQGNKKSSLKPILFSALLALLLILSLSDPQVNLSAGDQTDTPLLIALDLSDSMESKDKNRAGPLTSLQRGQIIIDDLLQQGFNRPVSLIAFAGSAHQVLPVSNQFELLRLYLGYLDASVMPVQGSDLDALLENINTIEQVKDSGFDLLIVTDGFTVDSDAFNKWIDAKESTALIAALNEQAIDQAKKLDAEVLTGNYLQSGDKQLSQRLNDLSKDKKSNSAQLTSLGYWFLYPVFLLLLYFFRRGFNLHWAVMLMLFIDVPTNNVQASVLDWWMTADQQGAYYFKQKDYKQAALAFKDPNWKAAAHLYAKDYKKAADIYEKQTDLTGLFNLAVANTKGRNYHEAQKIYTLLLDIDPENNDAANNLTIITSLIKEIQDTGDAQQEEAPPNVSSDPNDMNDDQLGADKEKIGQREVKVENLSVEELLGSEQKKQQWLRDISRDPKLFLGAKFQAEYNKQQLVQPKEKSATSADALSSNAISPTSEVGNE